MQAAIRTLMAMATPVCIVRTPAQQVAERLRAVIPQRAEGAMRHLLRSAGMTSESSGTC
jgi:hypothetical protein